VQAIIRELRGEKIDIVEWSDDAILFVTNALSPAKVQRVSIVDDKERVMEVVVEDKQLSLAIGKKGQNVRLASALIGAKIEIKSEAEVKGEVAEALGRMLRASQRQQTPVSSVPGIDDETAAALEEAGVANLDQLLSQTVESLAPVAEMGEDRAREILEAAQEFDNPTPEPEEESEGGAEGSVLEEPAVEEKG
jgi:N utilization substance protein A